MGRASNFIELVFGWRDADSGYGAGRHISAEIKAFFEGWLAEYTPSNLDFTQNLLKFQSDADKENARARLMQFAAALDELSQEIKQKVKESVDE